MLKPKPKPKVWILCTYPACRKRTLVKHGAYLPACCACGTPSQDLKFEIEEG